MDQVQVNSMLSRKKDEVNYDAGGLPRLLYKGEEKP